MAKVSLSSNYPVSAENIWKLIGGFNALPDWHPAIAKSEIETEGNTTLRRLSLVGGGEILEKLEQSDEDERLYSYSILNSPLPVANYTGTIRVREAEGGGCSIEWSSEFEPSGAAEGDAVKAIEGVYQAGFENLKKMFGG
ncbi:MAG: SRPBCC family protein [Kiloniellaceae bacterium]